MTPPYRNAYFALRHGRSIANSAGVIVSDPQHGLPGYGLSDEGRREVREKLGPERVRGLGLSPEGTVVVSSDFLRARQTADLFCELNGLAPPLLDERLRERNFGSLEMQPNRRSYEAVWREDLASDCHGAFGCEGTAAVLARLLDLLRHLEERHEGKSIVLVSHGDPLQILETAFRGLPSNRHSTLPHLETAEIRRLPAWPLAQRPPA